MTDQSAPSAAAGGDEDAAFAEAAATLAKGETPTIRVTEEAEEIVRARDDAAPAEAGDESDEEGSEPDDDGSSSTDDGQDDPLADASPAVKALFEALQQDRDALDAKFRSESNRTRQLNQKLREARETPKPAAAGKDDGQPSEDDRFKVARDEYPEFFDALVKPLIDKIDALEKGQKSVVETVDARTEAAEEAALLGQHGDFYDVLQKHAEKYQEFIDRDDLPVWAAKAHEANLQRITDSASAARLMTSFKAWLGIGTGGSGRQPEPKPQDRRRERQLAGSGQPTTSQRAPMGERDDDEESAFKAAAGRFAKQSGIA